MKIVDANRLVCPKPLILTKKALKETSEELTILIDNETSMQNVSRFLKDNGIAISVEKDGEQYKITTKRSNEPEVITSAEEYCKLPEKKGKHIYIFNKFGIAKDELGMKLTKGFLETVLEVDPLPDKIIFYHEGAKLVTEGSPVVEIIKKIEEIGVEILICGSCLEYYGIVDKVQVGIISNAYTLLQAMTDSEKIIYP